MSIGPWPLIVPTALEQVFADADEADLEAAQAQAGFLLWAMSGRIFTVQEQTVRPCFGRPRRARSTYSGGEYGPAFWPSMTTGNPSMSGSCGCSSDCSHLGPTDLQLPGPVESVIEIRIDGVVLDEAAYKVANHRWVKRVDGEVWPQDQDMRAADDAVGAFVVRYEQGIPVPDEGQLAAAYLTADILAGMGDAGASTCQLPPGVTSISRQGTTIDIDPRAWFADGLTGIEFVDRWIMTVNPHKSSAPTRIASPDSPRVVRYT